MKNKVKLGRPIQHLKNQQVDVRSLEKVMKKPKLFLKINLPVSNELDLPEYNLLQGMIERACRDLRDPRKHVRKAAILWIRYSGVEPWSFLWVCAEMRLSRSTVKKLIKLSYKSPEYIKKLLDIRDYTRSSTSFSSFEYLF